jgi:outer membrane receptor protein involved in Fe transport
VFAQPAPEVRPAESAPNTAVVPAAANLSPLPEEEPDVGGLEALLDESVVTTASRSAERASTAPSTVYTITADELHTFGMRSIDEALSYLGLGVYSASARDYSTGIDVGAQGVLLRDAGRHILALVDGHTMNSQVYGGVSINEAFGVPLEAIDHIEVMLGAGSVAYGANAMLLVVNVITRGARDAQGVRAIAEIGLSAPHDGKKAIDGGRYGLRYRLGAVGATQLGEHADLFVSAEWREEFSNSYVIGPYGGTGLGMIPFEPGASTWGGRADHQMRAPSGVLKLRFHDFHLMLQANHYEREMPLVAAFNNPDAVERQDALRFDLRHSADLSPRLTLTSRLYADHHRFAETSVWKGGAFYCPNDAPLCWFRRGANASWLGLEEQASFDWLLDGRLNTTLGFDLRARRTETRPVDYRETEDRPLAGGFPAIRTERAGLLGALFLQQIWRPSKWLTLNGGARLDADTDFGARLSPRAAVTIEPADGTAIRGSYSEAFRGPSRYELEDTDLIYRLLPESLAPEIVRVAELELQQRLSFATFSVRGYASFYDGFIQSRPLTTAEFERAVAAGNTVVGADQSISIVYDNLATIESYGISPSATLRIARGLNAGLTFNFAHSRLDGRPLPVIPALFGNAHVSWQLVPDGLTIAAAAILTGNRHIVYSELATSDTLGPQFDLKGTLSGPTGIAGLRFRLSFTYVHNPFLPYTPLIEGTRALLTPAVTRLQGFLGLQYDYGK